MKTLEQQINNSIGRLVHAQWINLECKWEEGFNKEAAEKFFWLLKEVKENMDEILSYNLD